MSVLDLIADQFYPIVFAVFAAASAWIILRSRRRRAAGSSGTVGVAGIRTATIATVATAVLVMLVWFALAWVLHRLLDGYYYGDGPRPAPPPLTPLALLGSVLLPVTWVAVPFLAVLDVYALWPARSDDRAGAAARAVLGLFLVAVSVLVGSKIRGAVATATGEATKVADERALEARSAGS